MLATLGRNFCGQFVMGMMFIYSTAIICIQLLQAQGPPVKVVTVMDILATIETSTVILKVDVESMECKVRFSNIL